jgi:GT2 family glycosyltransferase
MQAHLHGCTTIVVDNGLISSEEVVAAFTASMNIVYERIAERGLVSARNRAMGLALASQPEFLAFIDDDEVPEADWLSNLIKQVEQTGADFACGPVVPEYAVSPPRWGWLRGNFSKSQEILPVHPTCCFGPHDTGGREPVFQHKFNFSGGETMNFLAAWQQMAQSLS